MMTMFKGGVLVLAAFALAGCATADDGGGAKVVPQGATGDLKAALPYVRFEVDGSKSCRGTPTPSLDSQKGSYYIRLGALFSSQGADPSQPYESRTRWMVSRALWPEKIAFSLQANVTVDSQPAYQATIPLYTVSHDSSLQGESFSTDLGVVWQNTYVKVQPGSTITLDLEGKFSKSVQTGALSAALRVAKAVAGAVAPEAKVLTTLNQGRMQTEAQLWDKALGQLAAQDAVERIRLSTTPEQVGSNSCGLVTLYAPGDSGDMNPQNRVGQWRLGVDDWRRSLFSDDPCMNTVLDTACAAKVTTGLTPSRVLAEPLGAGKSVAAILKDQDIVPIALQEGGSSGQKQEAAAFCRRVTATLTGLGLTEIDAKLSLWAFALGYPMAQEISTAIAIEEECTRQILPFDFTQSNLLVTGR